VFAYQRVVTCTSDNPTADLDVVWLGDTTSCLLRFVIEWGDGSQPQTVSTPGGNTDQTVLASHTYQAAGSYAIDAQATVLSGNCNGLDGPYAFTLI
jgi:hypothetical protein